MVMHFSERDWHHRVPRPRIRVAMIRRMAMSIHSLDPSAIFYFIVLSQRASSNSTVFSAEGSTCKGRQSPVHMAAGVENAKAMLCSLAFLPIMRCSPNPIVTHERR